MEKPTAKKTQEIGLHFPIEDFKKLVEKAELIGLRPSHYCKILIYQNLNEEATPKI